MNILNTAKITANILDAVQDIHKLNTSGYRFLQSMSGFIAHYNINGFKEYYTEHDLKTDILNSMDIKRKERYIDDKFFTERDKDFYQSKYNVLNNLELKLNHG